MKKPTIEVINTPSDEFKKFYSESHGIKFVPEIYNGTTEKILQRDSGTITRNGNIYITIFGL